MASIFREISSSLCSPVVAAGLLLSVAPGQAKPLPGPREDTYGPFFRGLLIPEVPSVASKRFPVWLMQALSSDDSFLQDFGDFKSAAHHCCGRGDCRFVLSEQDRNGNYTAIVPPNTYQNQPNERRVEIPSNTITSTPPGTREPPSSVLCASSDLNNVWCFHPAVTFSSMGLPYDLTLGRRPENPNEGMAPQPQASLIP